jgi:hypothetical protein
MTIVILITALTIALVLAVVAALLFRKRSKYRRGNEPEGPSLQSEGNWARHQPDILRDDRLQPQIPASLEEGTALEEPDKAVSISASSAGPDQDQPSPVEARIIVELELPSPHSINLESTQRTPSLDDAAIQDAKDTTAITMAEVTTFEDIVDSLRTGDGPSLRSNAVSDAHLPISEAVAEGEGVFPAVSVPQEPEPANNLLAETLDLSETGLTTGPLIGDGDQLVEKDLEPDEETTVSEELGGSVGDVIVQMPGVVDTARKEPAKRPRAPRQYRPPGRVPSLPRETLPGAQANGSRERPLPIEIRVLFERAGFLQVSLLTRRRPELPEEVIVSGSGNPGALIALQDGWYQDVVPSDIGSLMRQGIEWAGEIEGALQARWSLSGHEIYVLSACDDLRGFVSTPRLVLGGRHVVFCVPERLLEVEEAIRLTGSPTPKLLDEAAGMPSGWIGLRDVIPHKPVQPSLTGDILDALRPLADIQIAFEGGIRLERGTWLAGYPPEIRLHGSPGAANTVIIDGNEASLGADGTYTAPGWDLPGSHAVWCTSSTRTYSLRSGEEEWDVWDAHSWPVDTSSVKDHWARAAICGALVRPATVTDEDLQTIVVPARNPVLIGAKPGQIARCGFRTDIQAPICAGSIDFEPVWALPADPFHSEKRVARVLLLGDTTPVYNLEHAYRSSHEWVRLTLEWCSAILAAGRKGLLVEPGTGYAIALWRDYKRQAKSLWKDLR